MQRGIHETLILSSVATLLLILLVGILSPQFRTRAQDSPTRIIVTPPVNSIQHEESSGVWTLPIQRHRRTATTVTPEQEEGQPQQVNGLYQGYGEHYVDLWCGVPPQRQTVIINTGGQGTAFPCSGCHDNCGQGFHTDRYFDETKSHHFQTVNCGDCLLGVCDNVDNDPSRVGSCRVNMFYSEGDGWVATEARDYCYVGGRHDRAISIDDKGTDDADVRHAVNFTFDLQFGCQTRVDGYFRTQLADGVLGMDNSDASFWKQMQQAGKIKDALFSLCYTRQPTASRNGTGAGAMTLGGSDDRLHLYPMVFSRHEDDWGRYFRVLLRKIHLRESDGGTSAKPGSSYLNISTVDITAEALNENIVVIESGTTDTYMIKDMEPAFQSVWKSFVGEAYDTTKFYTHDEMKKLPTILFQFEGAVELNKEVNEATVVNLAKDVDEDNPYDVLVAMPPQHYMEYLNETDRYKPRFFMSERAQSVVGANLMMGHDILFDVKNNRIGWAESNCDYKELVNKAGFDLDGNKIDGSPTAPPPPAPPSSMPDEPSHDEQGNPSSSDRDKQEPYSDDADKQGFCSTSGCRGLSVLVFGSLAAAFVLKRRNGLGRARNDYHGVVLEASELELQETVSSANWT